MVDIEDSDPITRVNDVMDYIKSYKKDKNKQHLIDATAAIKQAKDTIVRYNETNHNDTETIWWNDVEPRVIKAEKDLKRADNLFRFFGGK